LNRSNDRIKDGPLWKRNGAKTPTSDWSARNGRGKRAQENTQKKRLALKEKTLPKTVPGVWVSHKKIIKVNAERELPKSNGWPNGLKITPVLLGDFQLPMKETKPKEQNALVVSFEAS